MLELAPAAAERPLRVLCLGAHCDDIEIGCGGTLLRLLQERPGTHVSWVVFASTAERERELRASAAAFLACAGSSEVRALGLRESYLPWLGAGVKDAFEALLSSAAPDLVFTHRLDDRHQDHRLLAELTWNTFRDHCVLEYEIPKYEGDLGQPGLYVPLRESVARRKTALLLEHYPSQSGRPWFRAETFEALLRLRAVECRAPEGWAEAFQARKLVVRP